MDIVDLDEMGLVDGSSEFTAAIHDSPQIVYSQDGTIHLNPDDLATYGDRVTVVTLPNLLQILQDGTTQNIGYLINDNQVPDLNQSVIINQDNFLESNESTISSTQFGPEELQKHLTHFLDISSVTGTSINEDIINNKSPIEQEISELSAEILSSSVGPEDIPTHCVNQSILNQKTASLKTLHRASLVLAQQGVISLCSGISKVQELDDESSTFIEENSNIIGSIKNKRLASDHVDPPDKTGSLYCEECNLQFPSWKLLRKHKWKHLHDKPYKCSFCHESFNYEMNLNLHLATHNADKPYCPVCKKHFSRIASLKAHIMLHKREESVFCNICGEEFNSHIYLQKHLIEHDNPQYKMRVEKKVFKCNLCDRVFDKFMERKNHLAKVHKVLQNRKVKKFKRRKVSNHQCEFCQKFFDKPSQLLRHKRIHTGERPYKCELCASAFSQKGTLRIHMLKHTRERPYICPYCKGTFSQKGNLQAHVKRLHKGLDGNERIFKCHLCSCLFRKLGNLNTHFTKVHSFYTPIEGQLTKDKYEMRIENQGTDSSSDTSNKENQKEMYCEISKRDERQGILTLTTMKDGTVEKHNVYQKRMKSLSCSYCSKEFRRPGDLVRHVRTHTQEKPFKCNLCCKSFALQSTLALHLQIHSDGKRYSCSTCNKCYSTIRSLKIHKKKHMRDVLSHQDEKESLRNVLEEETIYKIDQVSQEVGVECLNLVSLDQVDLSSLNSSNIILTENGNIVDLSSDAEESENKTGYLYKCAECNMIFEKLIHLTVHMKTHKTSYSCEVCSCSFNSNSALQSHIMDEHPPLKFVCDCGEVLSSESALLAHKETHEQPVVSWNGKTCDWPVKSYTASKKRVTNVHKKINMVKFRPARLLDKHSDSQLKDQVKQNVPSNEVTTLDNGNEEVHTDLRDFIRNLQPNQLYITVDGSEPDYPLYEDDNIISTNSPAPGNSNKQLFENPLDACIFLQAAVEASPPISTDMTSILPQTEVLNRCDACNLVFTNIADFSLHKANHILEKSNTCLTCKESFSSVIEYEEHLKLHLENSVSSDIHGSLVESQGFINHTQSQNTLFSDLTGHQAIVQVNEPDRYNCSICNASFDSCEDMKVHESSHYQEVIQCNLCEQEFQNEEEFQNHGQKYHVPPKPTIEKKKSRSNWRPPARQLTEEETKALSNIEPDNATISEKVLLQSILEKERYDHPVKEEPKPLEIHRHRCKYCPKSFRKQSDLIRHIRIHTGERPYQCTSCNKRFSIKSTASSHMNTHSKDKPFECYICAKRFATTGSLKIHMRLHTGLKPFSCTMCDAKFRTSGHKKAHLLKHLKGTFDNFDKRKKETSRTSNDTLDSIEENHVINGLHSTQSSGEVLTIPDSSSTKITEGSEYLVPLKSQNTNYGELSFGKNSEYLSSLKVSDCDEDQGDINKSPKFLLSINDEGGGDGETPRYLLSIKDGGTGEDGFIVETISEEEIIVTITKGSDSNISKIANKDSSSQQINLVDSFNCTFCGKNFDKKMNLERHLKSDHCHQEVFQCTVCLESFERKSDLDLHILVHELDRVFSCTECTESFSLEEELRAHKCGKTTSLDLSLDHESSLMFEDFYNP